MVQKNLKPLRAGFVRVDSLMSGKGNRQVKIGGATFNRLIDLRENRGILRFKKKYSKQTKALKISLPKLYRKPTFMTVNKLVKNRHKFSPNDTRIARRVLIDLKNLDGTNKLLKFKLRDGSNKILTLTDATIDSLTNVLTKGYFSRRVYASESDALDEILTVGIKNISYETVKQKNLFKNGRFFRHLNNTDINLERYQIIGNDSNMDILKDHCLIYSLKQYGIEEHILNRIKTTFQAGTHFSKSKLHNVCEIIEKNINLSWFDKNKEKRHYKYTGYYKKEYDETIEIALHDEHYFINDETKYSRYSSLNYQKIKDKKDFHNIYRKGKRNDKLFKVNSLTLIRNLLDTNNFFKDHSKLLKTPDYSKPSLRDKEDNFKGIDKECEEYQIKEKDEKDKSVIRFYADIETDVTNDKHKPILMRFVTTNNEAGKTFVRQKTDTDEKLYNRFMDTMHNRSKGYDKVIIYFHHLKYDYNVLSNLMYHCGAPCEKDGQLYNVKFVYRNKIFELRDSLKLANMPLSKFQKSFQLPKELSKKEAIAYKYYTINNIQDETCEVLEYEKYLNDKDKKTFRESLKDDYTFNYHIDEKTGKELFDPKAYYKYYLYYDTLVLMKGMEKFEQIINKIIEKLNENFNKNYNVCMFDYLTISSLTHAIMGMYGAYDGVYKMTGSLREYCSKFITGGRVQVNQKYVKKIIEEKLADYDGVSLYPSAIYRLCQEFGLPMGKPKEIETKDKKELDKFDYYMVSIKINKINKYQQLPMVSYKDKDGLLKYVNKIDKPIITHVDMITLTDWIEFQDIEYEIINGIYFNEGFNKTMGDIIKYLFEERLVHKKADNQAMQLILKLMMNASYGKTITKQTYKEKVVISVKDLDKYIANNFNTIDEIKKLNDHQSLILQNAVDISYNMGQVGGFILSMSKRIMNEVFNTANKLECPLYYTDTDSIHCNYNDVVKIETQFRKDYNRELTGKNLGQFHIDFDLKGAASEIYSKSAIFLGKKCYIDKLESKDENGKTITGYHYRMKGVNVQGIEHCANTHFKGDIFGVYKHLSKGNEQEFILNPKGKKPSFEYLKNGGIRSRPDGTFRRTLKF